MLKVRHKVVSRKPAGCRNNSLCREYLNERTSRRVSAGQKSEIEIRGKRFGSAITGFRYSGGPERGEGQGRRNAREGRFAVKGKRKRGDGGKEG